MVDHRCTSYNCFVDVPSPYRGGCDFTEKHLFVVLSWPCSIIFYWILCLFTFQILFAHSSFHPKPSTPLPSPCLQEGAPLLTHSLLPHHLINPLCWGIKPSQNLGLPLSLMPNKAILCPEVLLDRNSSGSKFWLCRQMLYHWAQPYSLWYQSFLECKTC